MYFWKNKHRSLSFPIMNRNRSVVGSVRKAWFATENINATVSPGTANCKSKCLKALVGMMSQRHLDDHWWSVNEASRVVSLFNVYCQTKTAKLCAYIEPDCFLIFWMCFCQQIQLTISCFLWLSQFYFKIPTVWSFNRFVRYQNQNRRSFA